jgi:acetyl esterase/lipase
MPRRPFVPRSESLEGRALMSAAPIKAPLAVAEIQKIVPGRKLTDIVYTTEGGNPQRLDVYRPEGAVPPDGWPVVLAIHGGGWRKLSKEQYGPKVAPALTRAGFAVVAPDYLLAKPGFPSWPANFEQLRQAVLWIKAHAADYGFDPGRIAAMGESAGGHLAALLGTSPRSGVPDPAAIQAVVSFYGPADLGGLSAESHVGYIAARQMMGSDVTIDPALYALASPAEQASPGDAPTLIFQGTADSLVPAAQNERFSAALTRAGVPNRLVLIPGGPHGFGLKVKGRNLVPEIVGFLRQYLGGDAVSQGPQRLAPARTP